MYGPSTTNTKLAEAVQAIAERLTDGASSILSEAEYDCLCEASTRIGERGDEED